MRNLRLLEAATGFVVSPRLPGFDFHLDQCFVIVRATAHYSVECIQVLLPQSRALWTVLVVGHLPRSSVKTRKGAGPPPGR